jgi:hypothetical protein
MKRKRILAMATAAIALAVAEVRRPSGTDAAVSPVIFTGDCGVSGQSIIGGTVVVKK